MGATIINPLWNISYSFLSSDLQGGIVPIGTILPWMKSETGTPALQRGWVECNGQTISDSESVYNGVTLRNLNGENRFLRGNATSGATGGTDSNDTTHRHGMGAATQNIEMISANYYTDYQGGGLDNRPAFCNVVWIMRIK